MKRIIVLLWLLFAIAILGQQEEKINVAYGGMHGLYAGYGNYDENYEYNINFGFFPTHSIGLKGDYLFTLGEVFNTLKHKAGFTGGIIGSRKVPNPTFFNNISNDVKDGFITSVFGGLLYQIEYKNLYLQSGVVLGSQNYRSGGYFINLGYAFRL